VSLTNDGAFPAWLPGESLAISDGAFPAWCGPSSLGISVLGHEFDISGINTITSIGHEFTLPPLPKISQTITSEDLSRLTEDLTIEREEPGQLLVSPIVTGATKEEQTEKQRVENAIENLQNWMLAAAEMQKVLGEKLKNRTVTIDSKTNPAVRDAIRRLFGTDSSTITYDMYKKALEWRSKLLEEGRNNTYGTSS